jgi:molybdate transport system substrate-binding protein
MGNRRIVLVALARLAAAAASGTSVYSAWAEPSVLRIAAAADMRFAMDEVIAAFRQKYPTVRVEVTYGSSGNFYAQLSNHAPFDIFFSADVDYPRRLIREGAALADTEFLYGIGRLVVWVPRASSIDVEKLGIQSLLDGSVKKIAIANPSHAPYGRAAMDAMKTMGVYDQVKDRIVFGDTVMQTAQFVESGAADIGLISHSLVLAPMFRDKGRYWEVPAGAYPPREQGGVILSWARDKSAAQALRDFVLSERGKLILRRYGFGFPGE